MAKYSVSLVASAAQSFSAQLGSNTLRFKIQWQERFGYFRVDISTSTGLVLTQGRIMHPGVDLLASIYPKPTQGYGTVVLTGEPATPLNLGVDNKLVWSDV
jgi:hypothetical protein